MLDGQRVLVTGGTGSLGRALVRRILSGEMGVPARVTIFSRDEAKQYEMRTSWFSRRAFTDDIAYSDFRRVVTFRIGDVRDYDALLPLMRVHDVVFHAAALKQVPQCEYSPAEAVKTNIVGASNVVRAILAVESCVHLALAISTDKACKPVNVMGMTKAIQERLFVTANLGQTRTRFMAVRYGNVIASRGSVVPLFRQQIAAGGPVTVTAPEMTRFLLTLDDAVSTIFAAVQHGEAGDTYVPRVSAVRVVDLARALIGERPISIEFTGVRPGEKIDEVLVSEEELARTVERGDYYVIRPILPELNEGREVRPARTAEYSSREVTMSPEDLRRMIDLLPEAQD